MQFTCDKNLLQEAIMNVSLAVSPKSTIISLEGILFHCQRNVLTLTGYNLDLGIKKTIPVQGSNDGEMVLDASRIANIVNRMPSGNISFHADEKLLTIIQCENVEFTILGMSSEDYPEMPTVDQGERFAIKQDEFKDLVAHTLFAVAQNEQTPVYTGSLFDLDEGALSVVSVDGYRMAMKKQAVASIAKEQFVVPGKTLNEMQKILAKLSEEEEEIEILSSKKHIIFEVSGYSVISRLLEGDFLDYKNAVPKGYKTRVRVKTRDFLDSINRASVIINERAKSPIRCEFLDNIAKLNCETSLGKLQDSFLMQLEGETVRIGFNNKYMADALKASSCDEVMLEMAGPLSPIKVLPIEGDEFLFLVLPIRLKE